MATQDERLKRLYAGQPNVDISGGQTLPAAPQDLSGIMAQLLSNTSTDTGAAPSPTPDPLDQQISAAIGQLSGGGGQAAAPQVQPVLGTTAAEDANINRATAQQVVGREFGGSPALGETFSKLLPAGQGTLTAMPSGGYAASRTGAQQGAIEAARREAFAGRTDPAAMETRQRAALFNQLQPVDQALMRSDSTRGLVAGAIPTTGELMARVARGNYEEGQNQKMITFNRTGRYPGPRVPYSDRDAYRY